MILATNLRIDHQVVQDSPSRCEIVFVGQSQPVRLNHSTTQAETNP